MNRAVPFACFGREPGEAPVRWRSRRDRDHLAKGSAPTPRLRNAPLLLRRGASSGQAECAIGSSIPIVPGAKRNERRTCTSRKGGRAARSAPASVSGYLFGGRYRVFWQDVQDLRIAQ